MGQNDEEKEEEEEKKKKCESEAPADTMKPPASN